VGVSNSIRTTLGQFWEIIAQEFAKKQGYTVLPKDDFKKAKVLLKDAENIMQECIEKRRNGKKYELKKLSERLDTLYKDKPIDNNIETWESGNGVDLYFKKDKEIWIFDIKTVAINAKNGKTFDAQLIKWLVHQKHQLGDTMYAKDINVGYIFPYNSSANGDITSDSDWNDEYGQRAKPMTEDEIYAADKFWKFITGNENALRLILDGVKNATGDGSIVRRHLDKLMIKKEFAPEELNSIAEDAVKEFANYLFGIEFISKNGKDSIWSHGKNDERCEFKKSMNVICERKTGSSKRTGLEKYVRGFIKCPKCKEELKSNTLNGKRFL